MLLVFGCHNYGNGCRYGFHTEIAAATLYVLRAEKCQSINDTLKF
jgi:hypothetical protein